MRSTGPLWNAFLDAPPLRRLSLRSLRAYAYDRLRFARWFRPLSRPLSGLSESTLADYVRPPREQRPKPRAQTIKHRPGVVRSLYRFH